jgi:hypothetical protein
VSNIRVDLVARFAKDWDERCLAFYRTERPVRTVRATQIRRPIYKSAVGWWRVYEPFLGPLLDALGLGPVLSWAWVDANWMLPDCRIKSELERERIGIACGTLFCDAGAMRLGIHESPIV